MGGNNSRLYQELVRHFSLRCWVARNLCIALLEQKGTVELSQRVI